MLTINNNKIESTFQYPRVVKQQTQNYKPSA